MASHVPAVNVVLIGYMRARMILPLTAGATFGSAIELGLAGVLI